MVEFVDSLDELAGNLRAFRDDFLPDPQSMPDSEVQGIASYFLKLRLEGRLSKGRDSEFSMHRGTLDALADVQNRSEAVALFVTLQDLHGHSRGKRFPLVWKAMKQAGRNKSEPGRKRCKFHGGRLTGPKTAEGRARIAAAQRKRWARRRAELAPDGKPQDYPKVLSVLSGPALTQESPSHPARFRPYFPRAWERQAIGS
jgi:hypothetical protein